MFITKEEFKINKEFLNNGFCIRKVSSNLILDKIRNFIENKARKNMKKNKNNNFLNNYHKYISLKKLNDERLGIIQSCSAKKDLRENFYKLVSKYLDSIVGNELVMQKKINLSIQLPKDNSSLLDLHADTWSGDSPFETVVWLPLVDCYKTKSMYILPKKKYNKFLNIFEKNKFKKTTEIFNLIKKDIIWIDIKYGEVLIFNQCLPHGNVVNKENETRWSMNCRFKSIFSPYSDKKLGEFFDPITLKPSSVIGLNYKYPFSSDK